MPGRLGAFIRERRQALELTQEQLAERIGETTNQAEISRLERGHIQLPRRERLDAIARALDVSLGELLVRSGWMDAGDDLTLAIAESPANGWTVEDLDDLSSTRMVALVETIASAEARVAEAKTALETAQAALTTVMQSLGQERLSRDGRRDKDLGSYDPQPNGVFKT